MTRIKHYFLGLVATLGLIAGPAHAAGADTIAWDKFPMQRMTDLAALQHGAKLFVNYCLNCHSANFMRFNRLRDIGLTEVQIRDNLLFTSDRVGDTMTIAMNPRQAREWFGGTPPDLSVIARSRADHAKGSGADYLYTYLRTFYRDATKATGWNNLAFPNAGMPHVMWDLQGQRVAKVEERPDPYNPGTKVAVVVGLEQLTLGTMSVAEFDGAMADLVAFLQWMGEPAQNNRKRLGVWVLLFLSLFIVIAWRLNAAFWKDIK